MSDSSDPQPSIPPASASFWTRWYLPSILLLALIGFSPAFGCGFVNFDDNALVFNNPWVRMPLSWSSAWINFKNPVLHLWHPLTTLGFHLQYQLFGQNPLGYHCLNLVSHLLIIALVYRIMKRFTGSDWRAAMITLIFAVHPLRVESVVWVTEFKDVGNTGFALLGIWAYLAWVDQKKPAYYWVALLCMVLSLGFKPMFVTFPGILLLIDAWPLGRFETKTQEEREAAGRCFFGLPSPKLLWARRAVFIEKIPFFVLAAVAVVVFTRYGTARSNELSLGEFPATERWGNVPVSLLRYLGKTIYPESLAYFYPMPIGGWAMWKVVGSSILILAMTGVCLRLWRKLPWMLMGWCWFIVALLPVIGIQQINNDAMADRFTYFSGLGLSMMLVCSIPETMMLKPDQRRVLYAISIALGLTLTFLTYAQSRVWTNSVTLFSHAVDVEPNNALALGGLGNELANGQGDVKAGLPYLLRSVAINPRGFRIHLFLARALALDGQIDEAIIEARKQVKLIPQSPEGHILLVAILANHKQYSEALDATNAGLRIIPGNGELEAMKQKIRAQAGKDNAEEGSKF